MKIYFLTKDSFEIDVQNSETLTVSELKKIILQSKQCRHAFNLILPGADAKRALSLRDTYLKMNIEYVEQRCGKLEGEFEGKLGGNLEGKFEGKFEGRLKTGGLDKKFTEEDWEELAKQQVKNNEGKFEGRLIGNFEGKFSGKLNGNIDGKFRGKLSESHMFVRDCFLRNELKLKDYMINNNSELFLIPCGIGLSFIDVNSTKKCC